MADLFRWVARFTTDLLVIGTLPLHHAAAANVLKVDDPRCVLGLDLHFGLKVSVVELWVGMRSQIVECVVVFLLLSINIELNKKMKDCVSNCEKGTRAVSVLCRGIFGIREDTPAFLAPLPHPPRPPSQRSTRRVVGHISAAF